MICSFWVVDNVVNLVYVSICMYILRKVVKWPFFSISLIRKDQTRWGNAWLFCCQTLKSYFFSPGNLRQALGNFVEIVTWNPNSERTCKQRMLGNNHPGILQRWGILLPVFPGELSCPTQRQFFIRSAELNTSYFWVPKGEKMFFCSRGRQSCSREQESSHMTHFSLTSNLFSQWQMNHRNQSQVWLWKFFQRIFFKVKTRNLRFHSRTQTKWMWSLADAKCVMMGFGTICHCGEIPESRASTNESLNHKPLSPLAMQVLIWATSLKLCFLT